MPYTSRMAKTYGKSVPFDTKALLETSIDLSKARDFDSIAEILFDFVDDIVPINMSVLYILEPDGQSLKPCACRGASLDNLRKRRIFRLGEGGVGYVGREKKALLLTDVYKSSDLPIRIRQVDGEDPRIRSFLAVPLIVNNRLTGVLSASSSKANRYTMHDVEIVSIVANQVAALVELYAKMMESQRFSDLILENMNSGVLVLDPEGMVIMLNSGGEEISGYRHGRIRGKSIFRVLLFDPDTRKLIRAALRGKEVLLETPGTVRSLGGQRKSVRMSSSKLKYGTEHDEALIIIFRDVTVLEELQARLARYERLAALGKWTSCISHEIRNSLLPIRTAIQLLKKRIPVLGSEQEVTQLLEVLEDESERLNSFLNQLTAPGSSGKERANGTSLQAAIQQCANLMAPELREKNIEVRLLDQDECSVTLTKEEAKQLFLNLFFNSIDALDSTQICEARRIVISTQLEAGFAVVAFMDNGSGIGEADRGKVFEPFFTTKEKGTGLGLYTIHTLLTSLGGDVGMTSNHGEGTIVTLTIPRVQEEVS